MVHNTLSIPDVLAPLLLIIILTANSLADIEQVNIRCKAFTLPQRFSCTAFAKYAIEYDKHVDEPVSSLSHNETPDGRRHIFMSGDV